MTELKKTQWHPPFCAAMKLELHTNKKDLFFETELTLNTKPIQIDLLVIKKRKNAYIKNEIGRVFKGHNIFEYKSPEDTMGIDSYFKTLAYACLYKTKSSTANGIKAHDITVSLIHEGMPMELMKWFQSNGCEINSPFQGIYYVTGPSILFPTQIIVSSKLGNREHQWLKSLSSKMSRSLGECLINSANALTDKEDKENADFVLQLALENNTKLFENLRKVKKMCEALTKLMKPEIDAAWSGGKAEGKSEGATELSAAAKRLNQGATPETLLLEGFSADVVKSAKELLDALK